MPKQRFGYEQDAVEAGRKGGKASGYKRRMMGSQSPVDLAELSAKDMVQALIDAAQGKEGWEGLDPAKRIDAAKAVLNVAGYRTSPTGAINKPLERQEDDTPLA